MAPRTSGKVRLREPGGVKSSAMALGGVSSSTSKSINNCIAIMRNEYNEYNEYICSSRYMSQNGYFRS